MASPAEVLRALQAHLDPNPLVQLLPTALQLFSHVMLLAEAVRSEALVALGHYESGKGALRAQDVRLLNACAVLLWDELYRLSLDVRRAHVARSLQNYALSKRKQDLERIGLMVQSYFPDIPEGKQGVKVITGSRLLYIRCMKEEAIPLLAEYRAEAMRWMDDPGDEIECSETLNELTARMLERAEQVVGNATALESLFGGSRPSRRLSLSHQESLPSAASKSSRPKRPRHTEPVLSH